MNYKNAENFLQNNGIVYKLASGGKELVVTCPFCGKEKCYIENATGRFYCFGGSCGQGGGWSGLVERFGNKEATIELQPIEEKEDEPDLPPLDLALVQENNTRLFEPAQRPILDYLHNRLLDDATINHFTLGWDGRNITIPIFNANDECVNFKLKRDPTLPTPSKGMYSILGRGRKRIFNEKLLKTHPESIIVCEGEWDCMLLTRFGYPAVTSTAGANSFDESWVSAFEGIEKIFICFDIDRNGTGQLAAKKTAQLFYNQGLTVYIVSLPNPEGIEQKIDITDFFKKKGATNV